MWGEFIDASFFAYCLTKYHTTFSLGPLPQTVPVRAPRLNIRQLRYRQIQSIVDEILDPVWHRDSADMGSFADQVNNGPVVLPLLQIGTFKSMASWRRKPHARRLPKRARSRLPFIFSGSGASRSAIAWSGNDQFPSRPPILLTPFTRRIPAARSALSRPESKAWYAGRRTAPSRRLIAPGGSLLFRTADHVQLD